MADSEATPEIPWREILQLDVQGGYLPLGHEVMSTFEAWETIYSKIYEFKDVSFLQFQNQLAAYREQVTHELDESTNEEEKKIFHG